MSEWSTVDNSGTFYTFSHIPETAPVESVSNTLFAGSDVFGQQFRALKEEENHRAFILVATKSAVAW